MSVDLWAPAATVANQSSLAAWRTEAEAAAYIAGQLAVTPFIPESLRVYADPQRRTGYSPERTAANVTAALLTGQELGLGPMASLRSIDVVNGMPALRALTFRALVLAAGHELWLAESTNTRAIVRGKRTGSDHEQESVWTLDRARGLGLANKQNWRAQPAAMLIARATAECARLVAPEAVLGLPYTSEEIQDGADNTEHTPESADSTTRRRRTARRAAAPDPEPPSVIDAPLPPMDEPPLDEPPADNPPPPNADNPRMVTSAQRTAIHAALGAAGVTERDDKLATLSGILGDDIHSTLDLTFEQASAVLDYLAAMHDGVGPDDDGNG